MAIDFETANSDLTSACSIGIVGAYKGQIAFEKYYLINPQEPFSDFNISIHGITSKDVENEPTFDKLWDEIYDLLNGNIVFAHAADFDIAVLKSLIEKYHLRWPEIRIGCTLRVARIAYKGVLDSFRLGNISNYLEIEHNYHNAISDASICYYMLERVKRMYRVYDVIDLFEAIGLCFGELNELEYRKVYSRITKPAKIKLQNKNLDGMIIAFTGKPEKMTKTEFRTKISECGGLYSREINKFINTFIIFPNPANKHLQALETIKQYKEIKIYNEEEIIKIINGK